MKQVGWYKYVDGKEADFGPPLCGQPFNHRDCLVTPGCGKPMEVHHSGEDWLAFNCHDCGCGFSLSREYVGEGSGMWWSFAICSGQKARY